MCIKCIIKWIVFHDIHYWLFYLPCLTWSWLHKIFFMASVIASAFFSFVLFITCLILFDCSVHGQNCLILFMSAIKCHPCVPPSDRLPWNISMETINWSVDLVLIYLFCIRECLHWSTFYFWYQVGHVKYHLWSFLPGNPKHTTYVWLQCRIKIPKYPSCFRWIYLSKLDNSITIYGKDPWSLPYSCHLKYSIFSITFCLLSSPKKFIHMKCQHKLNFLFASCK